MIQPLLTIATVLAALIYVGRSLLASRGCGGCARQGCGKPPSGEGNGFVSIDTLRPPESSRQPDGSG